ncbi:MAG: hypothetical protein JAY94_04440 [Candidatus Thiodiazotropha endolucinida]|nr:hypothetical protein [Candidatus Thiodiazotropha taylori]MCW4316739.1 hypothetical protein [Candidatus Thiodiazotropha taylori]
MSRNKTTMITVKVLLFICIILSLHGCSTIKEVRELEKKAVKAEIVKLKELETTFSEDNYPPIDRHYSLFISKTVINNILSVADEYIVPTPELNDIEIIVHKIRTEFRNGYPYLSVEASVRHIVWDITVNLAVNASLEVDISNTDTGPIAESKVRILDVTPNIKWRWYEFKTWLFVRKLLKLEITKYLESVPIFPIPISQQLVFEQKPMEDEQVIPITHGEIKAKLNRPGFSFYRNIKVISIMFLEDGLRIHASIKE